MVIEAVLEFVIDNVSHKVDKATRSHPVMFGDMSHVTLNFDLSKFLSCISS